MARSYAQIFAICNKHGWDYKEKVFEFTGSHDSLSKLTDGEYREFLRQMINIGNDPKSVFTPKPGDAQRKKMIAIARDMRWDVRGKTAMMDRIDNWCLTQTKYKKSLNNLTVDELNKVVYIFEHEVKKSFLNNI